MEQLFAYLDSLGLELGDFLRETLRDALEWLMEVEVSAAVDAGYYERSDNRLAYRNGYRERPWNTQFGDVVLHIPKLRRGSYYPSFLTGSIEQELVSLIQKSYMYGVRHNDIEDLLQAIGLPRVHRSDLAWIAERLDESIRAFRNQHLSGEYPFVWLDILKISEKRDQHVVNSVAAIAVGVREPGQHEVLGFEIGFSQDDERLWSRFLRRLVARGLSGVRLVVSGDYGGLKSAVYEVFAGAEWQYCRTHCLQEVLEHVPDRDQPEIIAAISSIFIQPDQQAAREELRRTVDELKSRWPRAMAALESASRDLFTYMAFSHDQWLMAASTNVLLRVKRALDGNMDAIGILPQVMSIDELQIDYGNVVPPSIHHRLTSLPSELEVVHVLADRIGG